MKECNDKIFKGSINRVAEYLQKNFKHKMWNSPTGRENVEGVADVMRAGAWSAGEDIEIQVDYFGNIYLGDDKEPFLTIA